MSPSIVRPDIDIAYSGDISDVEARRPAGAPLDRELDHYAAASTV